jgi:hypothetical protein
MQGERGAGLRVVGDEWGVAAAMRMVRVEVAVRPFGSVEALVVWKVRWSSNFPGNGVVTRVMRHI